jgi:molybdate transport system substrate-binding protein
MRFLVALAVAAGLLVAAAIYWWPPTSAPVSDTQHQVTVAAAADLKFAFDDLVAQFQQAHPDIAVRVTYGSSGNFLHQLENHAPFDLFLSADVEYPRRLAAEGLALRESEFVYAVGHLVLWARQDSRLDLDNLGTKVLLDPSVRKIAIANPKYAPYGRAAEAALRSLDIYEGVQERLVFGDNVAQAAQFVQSGAADVGIIGLSQALAPTLRSEGRYCDVPADAYPCMEQGGIILSWVRDREAAEALRAFIVGTKGRAILSRYGFSSPAIQVRETSGADRGP